MWSRAFLVVLLSLLWSCKPVRAEGVALTIHSEEKETKGAGAPIVTQTDYTVTLYPRMIDVKKALEERIYDLNTRQFYYADLAKHRLTPYAIYAIPIAKIQHKQAALQSLFAAQKAADPQAKPEDARDVDIDMVFGSRKDTTTADLIQTSQGTDKISFASNGKPLAELALSDTALPQGFDVPYGHFLLYETALHPYIQQMAASSGKIFKTLHYVLRVGGETDEYTLTVTKTEKTASPGPELAGFQPGITGNDKMDAAILKVANQPAKTSKELDAQIASLTQNKDFLRAALAAEEMGQTLGDAAVQESPAAQAALHSSDALTSKTIEAISAEPKSTDDFVMHMAAINAALTPAGDYGYILELFRAKQIRAVLRGRQPTSDEKNALMAAFTKTSDAIVSNPRLPGAYCDLGEAYFNMDQPATAWLMWNQAAKLNPHYPGLQHAANLQAQAVNDFPEYF